MLGELGAPQLPVLPELSVAGISDATGRSATMLSGLSVDRQPYGWRLVSADSVPGRRATSWFHQGVDALVDVAGEQGIAVPRLALRVLGPVSLMARLWLPGGERALRDHGARADILASWVEGVAARLERMHSLTGARLSLAVAEPEAQQVLAGTVPTASGYRTVRSLDRSELRSHWRTAAEALSGAGRAEDGVTFDVEPAVAKPHPQQQTLVRTLIEALPTPTAPTAPSDDDDSVPARYGLALPWDGMEPGAERPQLWDTIAELVESGYGVDLTVPSSLALRAGVDPARTAQSLQRRWERTGLDPELLAQVRVSAPDLHAVDATSAQRALDRARQVAERASEPL